MSRKIILFKQERQCTCQRNIQARLLKQCCSGKPKSITYSERVFVFSVTQRAKGMHRIILSSVAYLALLYFSTLSHKWQDYGEKCY